jgi:hypothetical protein
MIAAGNVAVGTGTAAYSLAASAKAGAAVGSVLGGPVGAVVGVSLGIASCIYLPTKAKAALPWNKTNETNNLQNDK